MSEFDKVHETNMKTIADATFLRTVKGADENLKHSEELFGSAMSERQQLFENVLSQQQQLFAASLQVLVRAGQNGVSLDAQTLGTNPMEVAEAGIAAKIAEEVAPEVSRALKALVVEAVAEAISKKK